MERVGWSPWRALRARPDVTFVRRLLPAGDAACVQWPDGDTVIVVDSRLGRRQRNEAVAHEVVHLERGGYRFKVPALDAKEEETVRREVARRCLPLGALNAYVTRRTDSDLTVTAEDVAEEFDVTEELAAVAMTLLESNARSYGSGRG